MQGNDQSAAKIRRLIRWLSFLPMTWAGLWLGWQVSLFIFPRICDGEYDTFRNHPWLFALPGFLAPLFGGLTVPKYGIFYSAILSIVFIWYTFEPGIPTEWKPNSVLPCVIGSVISSAIVLVSGHLSNSKHLIVQ